MAKTPPVTPQNRFLLLQLICGAFLVSVAVYVLVARLVMGKAPALAPLPELLPWILAGVAVLALLSAQPLGALMARNAESQPTPEARQAGYRQAVVVAFAVRESAAIFGLVLTLLTGDLSWVLILAAAAVLAMVIGWPRRAQFDRLGRSDTEAPPPPIG